MRIKKAAQPAKTVKVAVAKAPAKKANVAKAVEAKKPAAKKVAPKKPAMKKVVFTVREDAAKEVYLAGSFNNWNPTAEKMVEKKGVYTVAIKLEAGTYQYKFVVDGVWKADPENADWVQNDCGTLNSVITVK